MADKASAETIAMAHRLPDHLILSLVELPLTTVQRHVRRCVRIRPSRMCRMKFLEVIRDRASCILSLLVKLLSTALMVERHYVLR